MEWQRRPLQLDGREERINGFSLLFTTRIGPPELREDYGQMLVDVLQENLQRDEGLREDIVRRSGTHDIESLRREAFDTFFEIGVSKILVKLVLEQDWYVDPATGVRTFKFWRGGAADGYHILHYAMDVRRQSPPRDRRAPGGNAATAEEAYRQVSRCVFARDAEIVTQESIDVGEIEASLRMVAARRRKYQGE